MRSQEDVALNSLSKGKETAKARMAAWGEEWAEEEDLPGMSMKSNDNEVDNMNVNRMYGKDINNAQQRMNKLKISKSKSKYK
jgi:hypothetical protein